MSSPGLYELNASKTPDEVHRVLLLELTPAMGRAGFSLVAQDERSLTFQRRRIPTWAIYLAIIGLLFFLLRLLFLLAREEQTILVSILPDDETGGTTRIAITGAESDYVQRAANAVLAGETPPAVEPAPMARLVWTVVVIAVLFVSLCIIAAILAASGVLG